MIRIAFVLIVFAAAACTHAGSVTRSQQEQLAVKDSNFVTYGELQADARQGHVSLYDALKSTRPYLLESGGDRGWPWVYLLDPSQELPSPSALNPLSPVTDIRSLERIPTSHVKWLRRYWSTSAPLMYKSKTDWSLVIGLR
jgi:hypothetical protein